MILYTKIRTTGIFSVFSVIVLSLVLLVGASFSVRAQVIPQLEHIIEFHVSPKSPGPRERVVLTIESFSIDLNRAHISWFVNETLVQEGDAEKSFSFTTGGLGSRSLITVFAEMPDGFLAHEEIIISPVTIDLLWEADTYTPPFYKGKTLSSAGGDVLVVAFPQFVDGNGFLISPSNLIYQWKENGTVLPEYGGKGEQFIRTKLVPNRSATIEVTISSNDNTLSGVQRISLRPQEPKVVVYEDNPLLGTLFNNAVTDTFSLQGQETQFVAYPYFVSTQHRASKDVTYAWSLNSTNIEPGEDPGSITVHQTGEEGAGTATISVSLQSVKSIFQRATQQFLISFGEEASASFGL